MKTALVFPGQGSQSVGMGKDFAEKYLDEASAILGFDLKKICLEGPAEELQKTEITQPAILTVSVAAFNKLKVESGQWKAISRQYQIPSTRFHFQRRSPVSSNMRRSQ